MDKLVRDQDLGLRPYFFEILFIIEEKKGEKPTFIFILEIKTKINA